MNNEINWALIPPHDFSQTNKNQLLIFNISKIPSIEQKAKILLLKQYNDNVESIKRDQQIKLNQLKHSYQIKMANTIKQIETITELNDSFWLRAMINSERFTLNKNDLNVLYYLSSIYIEYTDIDSFSFKVNYSFYESEYLSSKILWKKYVYSSYKDIVNHDEECKLTGVDLSGIKWKDQMKNPRIKMRSFNNTTGNNNSNDTNGKFDIKKSTSLVAEWEKVNSFFDMFALNEKKDLDILHEEEECEFIKDDFLPNVLYYYLNIIPHH